LRIQRRLQSGWQGVMVVLEPQKLLSR
jgi:hypothetical protein